MSNKNKAPVSKTSNLIGKDYVSYLNGDDISFNIWLTDWKNAGMPDLPEMNIVIESIIEHMHNNPNHKPS